MPAPKPCLGYRSRTAAAVALQAQGLKVAEIAAKIGIEKDAAASLLGSAHKARSQTLRISAETAARLRTQALLRGMTVKELAARIVDTAARDDLVTAILDDDPPQPQPPKGQPCQPERP